MKKILLLMLFLVTVSIRCLGLSETAIILHHGDDVTTFDGPSQLQAALDAAQDGDIIYLPPGEYDYISITKRIHIKGAGNNKTQIATVFIDIKSDSDHPTVFTEPVLEGVYMPNGFISLYNYTQGVTIKQCKFLSFRGASGKHCEVTLDRCDIAGFIYTTTNMVDFNIKNCYAYELHNDEILEANREDICILNSTIRFVSYPESFRGTFINSILDGREDGILSHGTYVNTLYDSHLTIGSMATQENCYAANTLNLYSWTPEQIRDKGFFGTDGTIVGCYGGPTPLTLQLPVPAVDEPNSNVEVDSEARKLRASLKLTNVRN